MPAIAVAFDGVVHDYTKAWPSGSVYGEFMPGAVVSLNRLLSKYSVMIRTVRKPAEVADWIEMESGTRLRCTVLEPASGNWEYRGVLLITRKELPVVASIDDPLNHSFDWLHAMRHLEEFIK